MTAACRIWLGLALVLAVPASAGAATVDCFADEMVSFAVGFSPPENGLRVAELPGIVLGPPGDSFPVTGSITTASLGHAGWVLMAFTDNRIVDGPGPDFIVFENAFFKTSIPLDPNQGYLVFAEPVSVAVSEDGVSFVEFPYDAGALSAVGSGQDGTPSTALPALRGLAGLTPTFTGNWTLPDDPDNWDPTGQGGVSGAGGDAFDLADVGLGSARYVLITDLDTPAGFAGSGEGADIDAVVALNSAPEPDDLPPAHDSDGDGLADWTELTWYGTDPDDADTDADGVEDGIEVARCRDPLSSSIDPFFVPEPQLVVAMDGALDSFVKWSLTASTATYDVVRGLIGAPGSIPQDVTCIEDDSFNLTTSDHPDPSVPPEGSVFFYLVRPSGSNGYGRDSGGSERTFSSGDCPP